MGKSLGIVHVHGVKVNGQFVRGAFCIVDIDRVRKRVVALGKGWIGACAPVCEQRGERVRRHAGLVVRQAEVRAHPDRGRGYGVHSKILITVFVFFDIKPDVGDVAAFEFRAGRSESPALGAVSMRVDKIALRIESEVPGAGVMDCGAVDDPEETLARDCQVGVGGALQRRALCIVRDDSREPDPVALL